MLSRSSHQPGEDPPVRAPVRRYAVAPSPAPLAEYFARRRGALLVDVPHLEELDRVDLFSRAMRTSAARGQVDQIIEQALEDGVIERHEAEEIMVHHRRHLAAREEEIAAIITLFARKKK